MERFDEGDAWVIEGVRDPVNFGWNACAGLPADEMTGWVRFEELRRGGYDPAARLEEMSEDGVDAEVLYPTPRLSNAIVANRDTAYHLAMVQAYNDWIHDRLERRSARFRCAGMIPTWDVAAAIAEVERVAKLGLAAAMLPLVGTPDYNHRQWAPLWSVIEEAGLPVVMHQGSGHDMLFYRGPGASVSNLLATQSMAPRTVALLATSGVLAAHPGLHFISASTARTGLTPPGHCTGAAMTRPPWRVQSPTRT